MQTSLSGMNAQATRLATVGDNITNATTAGYKRAEAAFSSMVLPSNSKNSYGAGGVASHVRYSIADQGALTYTTSTTDLSVEGRGFFVVSDPSGVNFLTRAGGFTATADGYLTNSAGYRLTGYPFINGQRPTINPDGYETIEVINLKASGQDLISTPSTSGRLSSNLDVDSVIVPTVRTQSLPSENAANSNYTYKTTQVDVSGTSDIYFTKLGPNVWEVSVFYDANSASSGFPYDLTDPDVHYVSTVLTFDPTTGAITRGDTALVPDPSDPFVIDLSGITQGAAGTGAAAKFGASVNLPSDISAIGAGATPASANDIGVSYTTFSRMTGFTGLNTSVDVDVYYTKISATEWEVSVFETSKFTPPAGFPYGTAGDPPLGSFTLEFDPATGELVSPAINDVTMPDNSIWPFDFTGTVSLPMATAGLLESVKVTLNLDESRPIVTPLFYGNTPAENGNDAQYSHKTALIAYDNLGRTVLMDIYYTKVDDTNWEVTVFDNSKASSRGFPYSSGPLATTTISFDEITGKIVNAPIMDIPIPGGATVKLDLFGTTQLSYDFVVHKGSVNGSPVAKVVDYQVDAKGTLSAIYSNGEMKELYQLALAAVESPNNLSVISGTVFQQSPDSGELKLGNPSELGLGQIVSGSLETSNVDIADELATLIQSQKMYTANSKVFQTGADILETIANLKR